MINASSRKICVSVRIDLPETPESAIIRKLVTSRDSIEKKTMARWHRQLFHCSINSIAPVLIRHPFTMNISTCKFCDSTLLRLCENPRCTILRTLTTLDKSDDTRILSYRIPSLSYLHRHDDPLFPIIQPSAINVSTREVCDSHLLRLRESLSFTMLSSSIAASINPTITAHLSLLHIQFHYDLSCSLFTTTTCDPENRWFESIISFGERLLFNSAVLLPHRSISNPFATVPSVPPQPQVPYSQLSACNPENKWFY